MNKPIVLCVDEYTYQHPEMLGLEGEVLASQKWLRVFTSGCEAREQLREANDVEEVWIASCPDVEPINLAASLKRDNPTLPVRLIVQTLHGSFCSRAHTAHVDEVLEFASFLGMYACSKKRANGSMTRSLALPDPAMPAKPMEAAAPPEASATEANGELKEEAQKTHKGFLMTIASGSGGTGKSSVAVMAALHASTQGYKTLLLDCDLQFGDLAIMTGAERASSLDGIVDGSDLLRKLSPQENGLVILAAPARLETAEAIIDRLPEFIEEALWRFDVVIANTGANWGEQHAVLLERSSVALFLIEQRSSSIRACRHALELCSRCGIASVPFKFALNHCSKTAPFSPLDVSQVLQGAPVFELKDGGIEVEEHLAGGKAVDLYASSNDFAKSIQFMMGKLLPERELKNSDASRASERGQSDQIPVRRRGLQFGRRKAKVQL